MPNPTQGVILEQKRNYRLDVHAESGCDKSTAQQRGFDSSQKDEKLSMYENELQDPAKSTRTEALGPNG